MHNHFELFDLPVTFNIDTELLATRYRQIQQVVHPDNFVSATDKERLAALQKTTQVNEAFQILKNPFTRGQYLLELYHIDNESLGVVKGDFLLHQIDLREELESIKQSEQLDVLNFFTSRVDRQIQTLIAQINQQFEQQAYQEAKQSLQQLQFFKRSYDEAMDFEI